MDRRERSGEPMTALLAMLQGWQGNIWTALPAIVLEDSFVPSERTVKLQVALEFRQQKPDGSFEMVKMPPLLDCPVFFPGAGNTLLTFPIKEGDEGIVLFSSRCIDSWWQQGGVQAQIEWRMHSLSDGFFLPGISSLPKVAPAISTSTAQFRSFSGATYVEIDPEDGFVNIVTPGDVNVTAEGNMTATITGNITATAEGDISASAAGSATINAAQINLNGVLVINGEPYNDHRHTEVKAGPDETGPKA